MAKVTVTDTSGFETADRRVDQVAVRSLAVAGDEARTRIVRKMRETPDSRGIRGRVASGQTIQATYADRPRRTKKGWTQRTTTRPPRDDVAVVIERSRRKGKRMPPPSKIKRWARRKLGATADEDGRAFVIARAIGKRGIPGIWPYRNTARELRRGVAKKIVLQTARRLNRANT